MPVLSRGRRIEGVCACVCMCVEVFVCVLGGRKGGKTMLAGCKTYSEPRSGRTSL